MNLSRKECLALIWLTETKIRKKLDSFYESLLTCVPEGAKMHQAEHGVDKEEAAHLDLCLGVSPPVFLQ